VVKIRTALQAKPQLEAGAGPLIFWFHPVGPYPSGASNISDFQNSSKARDLLLFRFSAAAKGAGDSLRGGQQQVLS
jgi:hypothetical protein